MITLITGNPGSGKTSLLVHLLTTDKDIQFFRDKKGKFIKDENGNYVRRPIYSDGIPELKLDYVSEIPEGHSVKDWHTKWAPTGTVFVIDECQRYFRPRSSSSKVPDYVADLEIHRHHGYDIVILTQHPSLVDGNVKVLTGRHLHIRKNVLGFRQIIEWAGCQSNPTLSSSISLGVVKPFRLKKKVFNLYRSSTMHTRQTQKISGWLPFLLVVFIAFSISGYFFYDKWFGKMPVQSEKMIDKTSLLTSSEPDFQGFGTQQNQPQQQKPVGSEPADYVARISEKPETKPLYDNVRTVVNMEYPEVCISSKSKCSCYTNQGTNIDEIPDAFCRKFAEKGVFNPYKLPISSASNGNADASKGS